MTYRVYLRSHAPGEVGQIDPDSRVVTGDPAVAEAAYRTLLRRDDLVGQPCAAVLSAPVPGRTGGGVSLYFSRFDREVGVGRIHPDAPIDVGATPEEAAEIAMWAPASLSPLNDWESDPRPFGEVLTDWIDRRGGNSAAAARDLRVPYATLRNWIDGAGRPRSRCANEGAIRRLMSLIDRSGTAGRV
jgi:hypothetical protein